MTNEHTYSLDLIESINLEFGTAPVACGVFGKAGAYTVFQTPPQMMNGDDKCIMVAHDEGVTLVYETETDLYQDMLGSAEPDEEFSSVQAAENYLNGYIAEEMERDMPELSRRGYRLKAA